MAASCMKLNEIDTKRKGPLQFDIEIYDYYVLLCERIF